MPCCVGKLWRKYQAKNLEKKSKFDSCQTRPESHPSRVDFQAYSHRANSAQKIVFARTRPNRAESGKQSGFARFARSLIHWQKKKKTETEKTRQKKVKNPNLLADPAHR